MLDTPETPNPQSPAVVQRFGRSNEFWIAVGGAALALIGTLGPWVHAFIVNVSGVSTDYGKGALVAAILAGAMLWRGDRTPAKTGLVTLVALLAAGGFGLGVWLYVRIEQAQADFFGTKIQVATAGWGLWACLIGSPP